MARVLCRMVESEFRLKEIKIELTDRCNLRCVHCSSNAGPSVSNEITQDMCLRIIDAASALGATVIAFSGGEPLLYSNLFIVIQRALAHGMGVSIYTTGNVNDFEGKVKTIEQLGVQRLIFSLFSGHVGQHEAVTQLPGSFDMTCHAIEFAAGLGLVVELHFVPLVNNYRQLEQVCKLGKSLGSTCTSVLRFVPQGRGKNLQRQVLNREQNIELREAIIELRDGGYEVRTGSPYNFLMLNNQPKCKAGIDRLTVLPDLRIVPCDAFKRIAAEDIVGKDAFSSLESANLHDCWTQSKYLGVVRHYLSTAFPITCASCDDLSKCHSGCLAQKFLANGSLKKTRDPDCLLVKHA